MLEECVRMLFAGPEAGKPGRESAPRHHKALLSAYLDLAGDNYRRFAKHPGPNSDPGAGGFEFEHIGLHGGLCELAWITQHFRRRAIPLRRDEGLGLSEDACSAFDDMVVTHLRSGPWQGSCDLGTGLAGLGLYLLDRLPNKLARAGLDSVVENLHRMAEVTPIGITWATPCRVISADHGDCEAGAIYDLSLPAGVTGVIYFLKA
jgi:hypothetical protein